MTSTMLSKLDHSTPPASGPSIVAFDLSLTCSGWADASGVGTIIPPKNADRGVARLRWIRSAVLERTAGHALVVIEGYSFASRGRAIISLGELGGVVRCALTDADMPWVEIAPTSRALFATGKGNAAKEHVLAEAIRRLGYAGHSNDEADALWLLTMARTHYAAAGSDIPNAKQRLALAAITWPTLDGLTL